MLCVNYISVRLGGNCPFFSPVIILLYKVPLYLQILIFFNILQNKYDLSKKKKFLGYESNFFQYLTSCLTSAQSMISLTKETIAGDLSNMEFQPFLSVEEEKLSVTDWGSGASEQDVFGKWRGTWLLNASVRKAEHQGRSVLTHVLRAPSPVDLQVRVCPCPEVTLASAPTCPPPRGLPSGLAVFLTHDRTKWPGAGTDRDF